MKSILVTDRRLRMTTGRAPTAGGATEAERGAPHRLQNLWPGTAGVPQRAQTADGAEEPSGAPQWLQNASPSAFAPPHCWQNNVAVLIRLQPASWCPQFVQKRTPGFGGCPQFGQNLGPV